MVDPTQPQGQPSDPSPPPSTSDSSPHTASAFLLEVLQLVLDPKGRILSANQAAHEQFSRWTHQIQQTAFLDLLAEIHPDWGRILPASVSELAREAPFLPWEEEAHPGLGWNLSVLPFGQPPAYAVTMVPGLAPEISTYAPEEGFSAKVGFALHNLFFRTQQVEARFRQFMRLLPGVPFVQDPHLGFTYWNEQLNALLGKAAVDDLKQDAHWIDWIHPDDRPGFDQTLAKCRRTHAAVSSRFRLHLPVREKMLYLLELRIPVRSVSGDITGYEGLWLDLTRQTLAERRLQRAAWKESLAEVSGSLSHDFNNILTGIVNLADLLHSSPDEQPPDRKDVALIRDSARQAQDLIKRIVALNREQSGEIQLVNLTEVVEQQRELIRILLPRSVKFFVDLPSTEIPVEIDRAAIRRVLLNFASNSRDAVDSHGRVDLWLREVDLAQYERAPLLSSRTPATGPAAELVFRDNGSGIDPRILHRIFDPYFSTKQVTRGSGLGLYSLTRFAEENGFDFGVRTRPNQGTDMILLIPMAQLEPEPAETPPPQITPEPSEKPESDQPPPALAVFSPEPAQWSDLLQLLQSRGFQPVTFQDPRNACKALLQQNGPFGAFLILMDHRKELPEPMAHGLRSVAGKVRRLLYLRGLNPDEASHSLPDCFDVLLEESEAPADTLQTIRRELNNLPERKGAPA